MTLDEIQDVIDNIAAEPSTNKKLNYLKNRLPTSCLKKYYFKHTVHVSGSI